MIVWLLSVAVTEKFWMRWVAVVPKIVHTVGVDEVRVTMRPGPAGRPVGR